MADVPALSSDDQLLSSVPGIDNGESTVEGESQETADDSQTTTITPDEVVGKGADTVEGEKPARGPNDLIDAEGKVVAKGGAERRLYEQAQRVGQENTTLKTKVTELEGKLQAVSDAGTVGTQLGLTPEEVTNGAQIIAAYKQNPIETIKYLLTQAQAAGHNITDVGVGTDVNAIKRMLDETMKPFIEDRQAQLDTQQNKEAASKEYNAFIARHPDAVVHQDAIAQLLEKDANLNPEAAFLKLQLFYTQRGLDFTKSLATLQKEIGEGKPANTQTTLPAGGVNPDVVTDTAQVASVDTSLTDIIKDSLKEAGITS